MKEATVSTTSGDVLNFSLVMKWTSAGARYAHAAVSDANLKEEALALLKRDKYAFDTKYGDHFVASVQKARCVTAVWNFSTKSDDGPLKQVRDALKEGEDRSDMSFNAALEFVKQATKGVLSKLNTKTAVYVSQGNQQGLIQAQGFEGLDFEAALKKLSRAETGASEILYSVQATRYSEIFEEAAPARFYRKSATTVWMNAMKEVYKTYSMCASMNHMTKDTERAKLDEVESNMLKVQTTIEQSDDAEDLIEKYKQANKKILDDIEKLAISGGTTIEARRKEAFDFWLAQSKEAEIQTIKSLR
jgi:hypothetical protein